MVDESTHLSYFQQLSATTTAPTKGMGELIKAGLEETGTGQREAGRRFRVSPQVLNRTVRGKHRMSLPQSLLFLEQVSSVVDPVEGYKAHLEDFITSELAKWVADQGGEAHLTDQPMPQSVEEAHAQAAAALNADQLSDDHFMSACWAARSFVPSPETLDDLANPEDPDSRTIREELVLIRGHLRVAWGLRYYAVGRLREARPIFANELALHESTPNCFLGVAANLANIDCNQCQHFQSFALTDAILSNEREILDWLGLEHIHPRTACQLRTVWVESVLALGPIFWTSGRLQQALDLCEEGLRLYGVDVQTPEAGRDKESPHHNVHLLLGFREVLSSQIAMRRECPDLRAKEQAALKLGTIIEEVELQAQSRSIEPVEQGLLSGAGNRLRVFLMNLDPVRATRRPQAAIILQQAAEAGQGAARGLLSAITRRKRLCALVLGLVLGGSILAGDAHAYSDATGIPTLSSK